MTPPVIETASGKVQGTSIAAPGGGTVARFLVIPYAAPPVGDLRWRGPQPVEPWPGVRDAIEFGPAAPQGASLESRLPGFRLERTSEDCLSLNVWTPALDGTRPVMVWIHGGAYTNGGSAQPVYDAARLAREGDVVVVTINYRLGALGFLAPEGDGLANCGLRDQLAALAWVREHAGNFGGDARRVTVFGESAGAGSILHLLASPLRGDTFDRAIVQSGEPRTLTSDEAATVADELARRVGVERADAGALRVVPVEHLVEAQAGTIAATWATIGMMPFNPALDGDICDRTILDGVSAGRADGVPLIIGTTRDELSLFEDARGTTLDDERLSRWASRLPRVPVDRTTILDSYRGELGTGVTNAAVWHAMRTDTYMRVPNLEVADAHAGRGAPTFVYRFDWDAPQLGAAHAVDVPFTFGTFDREGWDEAVGSDDRAEQLSAAIRRSWTSFAGDGAPDAGPRWEPYDVDRRPTMLFGRDGAVPADDPASATRRCWARGAADETDTLRRIEAPVRVLVVCTANQCRSPMAAALLRRHLQKAAVAAEVDSVGLRPGGVPAWPEAVTVMAELGIDVSSHVSREMDHSDVASADLVLGMTRQHVREAVALAPIAYGRSFTLKEFARRGELEPRRDRPFDEWLAILTADREVEELLGADLIDDVPDPIGGPVSAFRVTADALDGIVARAVLAAWGTASVGAPPG